jgi:hypothetical protein
MTKRFCALFLALLSLSATSRTVLGGIIVSNLGEPPSAFSPVSVTSDTFWSQQFTSGEAATLTQIITQLGNLDTGIAGDFTMSAALYSTPGALSLPDSGTLVTTFAFDQTTIPTAGFANIAFSPIGVVTLDPSLYYWFVLTGTSSDGTGQADWQFTDSSGSSGPGSLVAVGRYDVPGPWTFNDSGPFLMAVQGSLAIPEPSSLLLGVLGLSVVTVGATALRLRRQPA